MSHVLDLKFCASEAPTNKIMKLWIKAAIDRKVDFIVFELDCKVHEQEKTEREKFFSSEISMDADGKLKNAQLNSFEDLPKAFHIRLGIGNTEEELAPASGSLFGSTIRILLIAAEIPYWNKGKTSCDFETINPSAKWQLESEDLQQRVLLRRILKLKAASEANAGNVQ